jgi:hypothetical protein
MSKRVGSLECSAFCFETSRGKPYCHLEMGCYEFRLHLAGKCVLSIFVQVQFLRSAVTLPSLVASFLVLLSPLAPRKLRSFSHLLAVEGGGLKSSVLQSAATPRSFLFESKASKNQARLIVAYSPFLGD